LGLLGNGGRIVDRGDYLHQAVLHRDLDAEPAAKAGVMANDVIIGLDDEQIHGLTLNQAVEKMRGPVNTKIKLTIMRKGQDKPIPQRASSPDSAALLRSVFIWPHLDCWRHFAPR
jgi:C-terminal processing protease CtpA/Prc